MTGAIRPRLEVLAAGKRPATTALEHTPAGQARAPKSAWNGELLVVIHTFAETSTDSAAVRLISARKATKREIRDYEGPTP